MIVAGLTGSIAMGKSETARMFREAGIPVFDADATVHALYAEGGAAVPLIEARFPEAVSAGAVDRAALAGIVLADSQKMAELEALVHPLVWKAERGFVAQHVSAMAPLVVIDNPLLFESGRDQDVDTVIVVSATQAIQRERALARPGMTVEKLEAILQRQLPDAQKRAKAEFVVDSSRGLESARQQVAMIIETLKERDARNRT